MLNKLRNFLDTYDMLAPEDRVICAVSGGADSMALLWGMYLLRQERDFILEAAHFNHGLRGEESDRDAAFVADFCRGYGIPLHMGRGPVKKGEKGLEAAAREARYAFFATLDGKIATAHTANDNAETVLLNMVRGSGLKGLGAIAPVGRRLIRPMLMITRQEVLAFLQEYHIPHVEDSSNGGDAFLRNRLRHSVMPLLEQENPRLAENMSAMALRLRQDEACLEAVAEKARTVSVAALRELPGPLRSRVLEHFLKENGVREPEARHLALLEELVFSDRPSAKADFPGGICISRCYDRLQRQEKTAKLEKTELPCAGTVVLEAAGLQVTLRQAQEILNTPYIFTVDARGAVFLGSRLEGDVLTLPGGTKSVKKLFVDRKIPAARRMGIPVIRDEQGILGVYGIGADEKRKASRLPALQLVFEKKK